MSLDLPVPALNRELYKDYPPSIREAYARATKPKDWSKRHAQFLQLGETSIAYLSSLAFSDYRSQRDESPEVKIERALARSSGRRLSTGGQAELFELSCGAVPKPFFDIVAASKTKLQGGACFAAAVEAIQDAVEMEARNLHHVLEVRMRQSNRTLSWTKFWALFVSYRNRASGHPAAHRWPVDHEDYYDLMGPFLEAALVEALVDPAVAAAFERFPVGKLEQIQALGTGEFAHEFSGDDSGLPFKVSVVCPERVTERWPAQDWRAEAGREFLLERRDDGRFAIRALFRDLMQADLPKPRLPSEHSLSGNTAVAERHPATWSHGKGSAPGTCGELVQGLLPDGTNFHVTCPITKSATVVVRMRSATSTTIHGLRDEQRKLEQSLVRTAKALDLGELEIHVDHWSDLDIGKGMGSSTADVLSAARALADASQNELTPEMLGEIASSVESSDGTMYEGLAMVNHKTGIALRQWAWWPELAIAMIIPSNRIDTESITFAGKGRLAAQYQRMFNDIEVAVAAQDPPAFAAQATVSGELNQRFVPNPYFRALRNRLDEFGALGANVGHTGTVCGLLWENTDEGSDAACAACMQLQEQFPHVEIYPTATPGCPNET